MIRRTPRSTRTGPLVPYTTLVRSSTLHLGQVVFAVPSQSLSSRTNCPHVRHPAHDGLTSSKSWVYNVLRRPSRPCGIGSLEVKGTTTVKDRKSTRLNSSH